MGSFFKNIINDSRSGIPSVAQKIVSSSAEAVPEHKQMGADIFVSEIAATELEIASKRRALSKNVQPQTKASAHEYVNSESVIDPQKIQPNVNWNVGDMAVPLAQHEQQTLETRQSINAFVQTGNIGKNDYTPDLTDMSPAVQTEESVGTKQSRPADIQNKIDDFVTDGKDSKHSKSDQLIIDAPRESVHNQEQSTTQHKTDLISLDKSIFAESELNMQDNKPGTESGSDVNPENASQRNAFQSHSEATIQNVTAQDRYVSKSPTVVLKNETRIEAPVVKSAVENRKDTYPQVRIGLVNVIVEGPKLTQGTQSTASNTRRDDQTSRHYLRSL